MKLAVDIVDFAHRNYYDNIYLMSGDADFMQALFAVRRLNKRIGVLCLENKIIFKSFVFFDTLIVVLRKMPIFRNLSKKITKAIKIIKINKEKVAMSV